MLYRLVNQDGSTINTLVVTLQIFWRRSLQAICRSNDRAESVSRPSDDSTERSWSIPAIVPGYWQEIASRFRRWTVATNSAHVQFHVRGRSTIRTPSPFGSSPPTGL